MMRIATALAIALGLVASPAIAADTGFYAGVGVGEFNTEISDADFDEGDTGFKVFGGYQVLDWLGVELGYVDGGSPSISESDPDLGSAKLEVGVSAITVGAVGTLPIGDMFELYGKLGMAFWEGEIEFDATGAACDALLEFGLPCSESVDDDGEDFFYGVGAGLNIGEHFNVRAEYEVFEIDPQDLDADASLLSISAVYRF